MKRAYWFLLIFGIWCIASAYWYMFAVKGIPTELTYFKPHPRLLAIAEVLIMLLIACLLGYGIAWTLRQGSLQGLRETNEELERSNEELAKARDSAEGQMNAMRQQWSHEEQKHADEISKATEIRLKLANQIEQLEGEIKTVREKGTDQSILDQLEGEVQALRFKTRQLEFKNEELEQSVLSLKKDLQDASTHPPPTESNHPFVRPVTENEKDDLTQLKGIGPFIEKRLNMVGIYTLRQISEFTPEVMEQISKAIEFFPHRMTKDNWVGQAKELLNE